MLVTRVAWDVPVRLVLGVTGSPGVAPVRSVRCADPGVALPGVAALRMTLRHERGRALIERIERIGPVRSPHEPDADPALEPLRSVLAELRAADPEGIVAVHVEGTPFTRSVLEALCRVPAGQRITYAGLAASAGRPRAVRAVASVMARNPVPLVLPCHRVVPTGGGTGRYAWGGAVKAALLEAERAEPAAHGAREERDR
jgi:methylated-DNA-[protein]-cysteine S-methyltransferase